MQRNQVTRRSFLKGLATIGVGAAGAQILAACAPPAAPAAGGAAQAPSTTESSAAPAATDVSIRVQVAPGSQAAMPGVLGARYQADTGVEVVLEEVIYGEIETKTQTGYISNTQIGRASCRERV